MLMKSERENVYDEDPSSYFPLLKLLSDHPSIDHNSSPRSILETSLELITLHNLLPKPSSLSTFHLALALHTSVPRIEASFSFYESTVDEERLGIVDCDSWVDWNGKAYCSAETLNRGIEPGAEETCFK